ncbi:hypothetical protein DFH27DRAFT_355256 [Peziza echinospora]|nr:hypothetical protein DFH27DRAFT_355256 [Peziza echinospora]
MQSPSRNFEAGKANSHQANDAKDERSLSNRLAADHKAEQDEQKQLNDLADHHPDPTAAAISHGNKPSRGAVIESKIEKEEREYLKNKGKA